MGILSVYLSEDQHEKFRQICKLGRSGPSETFQRIVEATSQLAKLAETPSKDVPSMIVRRERIVRK
jgi:hypothetical protein